MRKSCIVLAFLLVLAVLSGCRGNVEVTTPTLTPVPGEEKATVPTRTETAPPSTPSAFEEQTLVETENVLVRLTGIKEDPIWGYTLKVYLENRTEDNLMFSVEDAAVNGFMCDPFWASEVRAGMKANEQISFSKSDFEANGIQQVTDILFTLRVYDSDDWTKEDYVNQSVKIKP